jgi:general nucleoside transport system permease protein
MTLTENAILEAYGAAPFSRRGWMDWRAAADFAKRIIARYDVRCPGPETRIRLLSGGNMQKLILGRALEANPRIILANQPVRGLDVGAVAYVQSRLIEARAAGAAVLLISEDLDEILELSDVIHVISAGRLSPEFPRGTKPRPSSAPGWPATVSRTPMRLEPVADPTALRTLGPSRRRARAHRRRRHGPRADRRGRPLRVLGLILQGAAGSRFALLETLNRATPLIFTGLAVAVAFRARLWNIGAEAQLYAGAIVAVLLGTGALPWPSAALLPVMALAAMLAGALVLLGPAVLKTRFGVDEVVTTLLFNFIMLLFVSLLLEGPLKDPMGLGWPQSAALIPEARLPRIVTGLRLHWGFGLGLIAAVAVWILLTRTTFGYEMRAVGLNREAARFAGMPVNRILLKTAALSGGLAALAGFSEVAGLKGNLTLDLSPGFGYTGIIVAMLALLHPLGVVATALFVAGVFVGADAMSRTAGVPSYIADILLATALLSMVTAIMLTRFRIVRG